MLITTRHEITVAASLETRDDVTDPDHVALWCEVRDRVKEIIADPRYSGIYLRRGC